MAITLCLVPLSFAYLLFDYLNNPNYEGDHGIAVAGLFLTVPLLSYACQLVVYSVVKVVFASKEIEGA